MPQAHKQGNKAISVWLSEEDRALLKALKSLGHIKDQSSFIRQAINEKAIKEGLKKDESK